MYYLKVVGYMLLRLTLNKYYVCVIVSLKGRFSSGLEGASALK